MLYKYLEWYDIIRKKYCDAVQAMIDGTFVCVNERLAPFSPRHGAIFSMKTPRTYRKHVNLKRALLWTHILGVVTCFMFALHRMRPSWGRLPHATSRKASRRTLSRTKVSREGKKNSINLPSNHHQWTESSR